MKKKNLAIIIIIAHKEVLSEAERASLNQCYKILGKYPIKLICPKGLNVAAYQQINPDADIIFIDPKWQADYRMFNELKKDKLLYEKFKDYKFMLYYELDAWVFSDQLAYWCEKGYDYIGAPWFENWHKADKSSEITGVGNGGFSLRNIQKSIQILKRIQWLRKGRRFWYRTKLQALLRFEKIIRKLPIGYSIKNDSHLTEILREECECNEDYFWCKVVGSVFEDFHIAPVQDAIKFSFDANPSLLFSMNNNQLPFGCHAWERYEPKFWGNYIPVKIKEAKS